MKIKLLKSALIAGSQNPTNRGAVIESTDEATIAEYKALIAVGYAKVTKEDVTANAEFISAGGNTAPISGIRKDAAEADDGEPEGKKNAGNAPSNKGK